MIRRISIFGATGSVGRNTLDLVRRAGGRSAHDVVALTGGRNVALLARQAREFGARLAVTAYPDCLSELRAALAGSGVQTSAGAEALAEAAMRPTDWVMSAIVGAAGLVPGMRALTHGLSKGGILALANKESLVAAGRVLLGEAAQRGVRVLPVDSEHSAVFQALVGEDIASVERIIITASGGPFRDWPAARMAKATVAQAAAHPKWSMGQRISIDSASLFNKAMELIEAKEYFGVSSDQIEVLVHPQSIVHALVGFCDGGLKAHLGPADMRHAIGYALNWPKRAPTPVERLDLARLGALNFEAPDEVRFPALRLAREVMAAGGQMGAVFNASKEAALDGFLAGEIGFGEMAELVEGVLSRMVAAEGLENAEFTLDTVLETDHLARVTTREAIRLRRAS